MRKPIFPRIISLIVLYVGVFIILVVIQFTEHRNFTQKIGDFVVSGHYGKQVPVARETSLQVAEVARDNARPLNGELSIFYGGMEFFLTDDDNADSLCILNRDGKRERTRPVSITISKNSALFMLAGGTELSFTSQNTSGRQELRIGANLPEGYMGLELPYRPLGSSRIRHNDDGESHIIADGKSYHFTNSTVDSARHLILMDIQNPLVFYGVVPGIEVLDPSRFILSSAQDKRNYNDVLSRWRDRSFSRWGETIGDNRNEEALLAYLSESLQRGSYQSGVSAISSDFLEGNQKSFESTAYIGHMDQGLRSNAVFERENFSRFTRLIENGSVDFLKNFHVIEFIAIRGYGNLLNSAAGIIRSIDTAALNPDLIPGILEGYMDWQHYLPNEENPFEGLMDQACFALSEGIVMDNQQEQIFVFNQGMADLEFNLRLGAGLIAYGEYTGQEIWDGIGRSLVLSVLSLVDETGTAPLTLSLSENGDITPADGAASNTTLSSARIYRQLRLGDYAARAISLGSAINGVWTWTAAAGVTASFSQENNALDISVSFPSGETHYMLIRGIQSFTQIQLYNIPFRTDPQFERYDSSGWAYSPSEQTLMVKMKHRLTTEHIRVFY
ncbi:hypothetical protein [Treponema primitia]|uniref:hypothetical protein n=1 Tax=Treponema primitia TaxID=88058 RepID=UPI000255503A|nr:hypothetical protein [Treponema primitia]